MIHDTAAVGRPKVESAAEGGDAPQSPCLGGGPSHRLTEANAAALIARYDVVADGSDNFATRYSFPTLASPPPARSSRAALGRFDGTLTLRPYETGRTATPTPPIAASSRARRRRAAYRPAPRRVVLGALAGVMGSLMAMEVIRAIAGFGEPLVGRLLMIDARSMRFETLHYGWDPENPLTGTTVS